MANEKRLDLIDRNALMDSHWWNGMKDPFDKARAKIIIQSAKTVDAVEVVHGRWIEDVATDMIACTECGHAWNIIDNCTETFNYCPNCGAKMDGGRRTDG